MLHVTLRQVPMSAVEAALADVWSELVDEGVVPASLAAEVTSRDAFELQATRANIATEVVVATLAFSGTVVAAGGAIAAAGVGGSLLILNTLLDTSGDAALLFLKGIVLPKLQQRLGIDRIEDASEDEA